MQNDVTKTSAQSTGIKHDQGKLRWSLLPIEAVMVVIQVFMFGAKKYGDHNYRAGMDHTRLLDACLRHVTSIIRGEDNDSESNLPHWAHAVCCLLMYGYYKITGRGRDDRYMIGEHNANNPE